MAPYAFYKDISLLLAGFSLIQKALFVRSLAGHCGEASVTPLMDSAGTPFLYRCFVC